MTSCHDITSSGMSKTKKRRTKSQTKQNGDCDTGEATSTREGKAIGISFGDSMEIIRAVYVYTALEIIRCERRYTRRCRMRSMHEISRCALEIKQ